MLLKAGKNNVQGLVVRRPTSAIKPEVKFKSGFLFFVFKSRFYKIIFTAIFRSSNHQLVDKKKLKMLFKLSKSEFKSRTNPGLS